MLIKKLWWCYKSYAYMLIKKVLYMFIKKLWWCYKKSYKLCIKKFINIDWLNMFVNKKLLIDWSLMIDKLMIDDW